MGELIITARALWHDKRALLTFYGVFLALLATVFLFLAIGLGTWAQVLLSFALPFVAGWLFFLLQALCLSYDGRGALAEWLRMAARESGKLCLVSLPLCVVGWLLAGTGDAWWVTAWRVLFFAFVLPLTLIHLWLAARRTDVVGAWRGLPAVLAQAFAPATLLTYATGLAVFGLAPYLLSWARLPSAAGRLQIAWFGLRATLALVLALFGWVATVIMLGTRWARKDMKIV